MKVAAFASVALLALVGCADSSPPGRFQTTAITQASYLVTDTRTGAVYVGDYSAARRSDTLILFSQPIIKPIE